MQRASELQRVCVVVGHTQCEVELAGLNLYTELRFELEFPMGQSMGLRGS